MSEGLRHDLAALWVTRRTSGFPWPFRYGFGRRRDTIRFALTGYPSYSPVPLWRQIAGEPLRPWRYVWMVRGIARARGANFRVADYDEVP